MRFSASDNEWLDILFKRGGTLKDAMAMFEDVSKTTLRDK